MTFLIKLFILIVAGCAAIIMLIFTAILLHVAWGVVLDKIKDVYQYASGLSKDNER